MRRPPTLLMILILVAASSILPNTARAEEQDQPGRLFFGVNVFRLSVSGELDGETALGIGNDLFLLPKLSPDYGIGFGLGGEVKSGYWSIALLRSSHKTDLRGMSSETSWTMIDAHGQAHFLNALPVQPFVLLGLSFPWLRVLEGVSYSGDRKTANYFGAGFSAGAGIAFFLGRNAFLSIATIHRSLAILTVKGAGKVRDVTNLYLEGTGPKREGWLKASTNSVECTLGIFLR